MLLVDFGTQVSTDRLVDGIWGDSPPATARKTVQVYVSRLRASLGESCIETGLGGYRLAGGRLDAREFEDLVTNGRSKAERDPRRAAEVFGEALAMWVGPAYAGFEYQDALRSEILRLDELRISTLEDRISAELDAGAGPSLVGELESLIHEYPLRERLHAQLMLALYRAGRQADALRVFKRARDRLVEELGIEPGPELGDLEQRILEHNPKLAAPAPAAYSVPVRAIRSYELREEIRNGSPARVFRAYDRSRGRTVALKLVPPEVSSQRDYIERFESTAADLETLVHPHILPLIDLWRDPDGAYLIWDWMEGGSLREHLADGRPWAAGSALNLIGQIGSALSHAHRQGQVHGGLKPENVLLDAHGVGYLADFPFQPRTKGPYVAPELGASEQPTPGSDIYSLALICHELLTGALPGPDRPSPLLSGDVQYAIARATTGDPNERFDRVDDFLEALREATGQGGVVVEDRDHSVQHVVRNPYKGLRAFQESDEEDFFGRDEMINRIVSKSAECPVVSVVGPSGSGKSSLVRAGLIPALRAGAWNRACLITDMYPGAHPFEEMDMALRRIATNWPERGVLSELTADAGGLLRVIKQILPDDDTGLVLVIDQFEELFSILDDEATRGLFLAAITAVANEAGSRVLIVTTLRADFFDRPLRYSEFGKFLERGLVPLTAPSRAELAEAVSGPARRVGLEIEDGLVSEIVSEVADQPGALPLMQFALTEMVEQADSHELTIASFRRQGGVGGAIGAKAEDLFLELDELGKHAIQQAFLRLAHVDRDGTYTRRRVRLKEVTDLGVDRESLPAAIQAFAAKRLLTLDRDPISRSPTVEVAHEALLGQWPRLHQWLDERRQDLTLHDRFAEARREWLANDSEDSFLLTEGRLTQYVAWAETSDLRLTPDELAFLERSLSASEEQRASTERKEIQRIARSALSSVEENPERSLLVALTAADRSKHLDGTLPDDVAEAIHEALIRLRIVASTEKGGAIALAPDNSVLAVAARDGSLTLHDPNDLTALRALAAVGRALDVLTLLSAGDGLVIGVDARGALHKWDLTRGDHVADVNLGVSGTGRAWWLDAIGDAKIVAAGVDRSSDVSIIDITSDEVVQSLVVDSPTDGRFSPDGSRLAVSNTAGEIAFFDTSTWRRIPSNLPIQGTRINKMTWSPDGNRLAFTTEAAGTTVWDFLRSMPVQIMPGLFPGTVAFDPTGVRIVVGGTDGKSRCIEVPSGSEVATLAAHDLEVNEALFTMDGDRVITTSADGTRVWDITPTGQREVLTLQAHTTTGNAANSYFSKDGSLLVTTSKEREAKVWDTRSWKPVITIRGLPSLPGQAAFSPDGTTVAVARGESPEGVTSFRDTRLTHEPTHTEIFDAMTGDLVLKLAGHEGHEIGRAFHPQGRHLVTAGLDSIISLWDLDTGRLLDSDRGEHGRMNLVSFDPRGELVVAGNEDGTFTIRKVRENKLESWRTVAAHDGAVFAFFSPDGQRIATASEDGTGAVWDVDGNLVTRLIGHTSVVWNLGWAPDGNTLATVSIDNTIRIWDPATGELRMTLTAPGAPVAGAEISRNGIMAVPAGPEGRIYLYTLNNEELVRIARQRVTRPLAPRERVAFGVDA
jgi:WD40 repeat protein/serine/threonine protein kinase